MAAIDPPPARKKMEGAAVAGAPSIVIRWVFAFREALTVAALDVTS